MDFAGKVVLITGGAAGIGKATAARFKEADATVIICDVNEEAGQATAVELDVAFYQVNITDKQAVQTWVDAVMEEYGCTKSRFDTALKNLQISLNVVRSNDPTIERDTWLAFQEQYPDIWYSFVAED